MAYKLITAMGHGTPTSHKKRFHAVSHVGGRVRPAERRAHTRAWSDSTAHTGHSH